MTDQLILLLKIVRRKLLFLFILMVWDIITLNMPKPSPAKHLNEIRPIYRTNSVQSTEKKLHKIKLIIGIKLKHANTPMIRAI